MRRLAGAIVLAGLAGTFLMTTAGSASAAEARGCSGSGRSIGEKGLVIDRASAPGTGGTKDDPFDVETKGKIAYDYRVNQGALSNGRWTASIDTGLPFVGDINFSGTIDAGSSQSGDGVEPLEDHLRVGPFAALAGKLKITIKARAGGVNCTVSGYLQINDSPVKSAMFIESVILLLFAMILFYLAMMGQIGEDAIEVAMAASDAATGEKSGGSSS